MRTFLARHFRLLCAVAACASLIPAMGCKPEIAGEAKAQAAAAPAEVQAAPAEAPAVDPGVGSNVTVKPADKSQLETAIQAHLGQVVFVDFWATWCGPCKEQFPHTVELAHKYKDQGLAVISVSCDDADQQEAVLAFLKSKGADFDNFISTHGIDTIDVLEIAGGALPHYRIYDRQGKLVKSFGPDPDMGVTPEEIEVFVKEALAQPKS